MRQTVTPGPFASKIGSRAESPGSSSSGSNCAGISTSGAWPLQSERPVRASSARAVGLMMTVPARPGEAGRICSTLRGFAAPRPDFLQFRAFPGAKPMVGPHQKLGAAIAIQISRLQKIGVLSGARATYFHLAPVIKHHDPANIKRRIKVHANARRASRVELGQDHRWSIGLEFCGVFPRPLQLAVAPVERANLQLTLIRSGKLLEHHNGRSVVSMQISDLDHAGSTGTQPQRLRPESPAIPERHRDQGVIKLTCAHIRGNREQRIEPAVAVEIGKLSPRKE